MKRYLLIFFAQQLVFAQTVFNNDLKLLLTKYEVGTTIPLIVQTTSLQKLNNFSNLHKSGLAVLYTAGETLARLTINDTDVLMQMVKEKIIIRAEYYVPKKLKLLNDTMVVRNRILPVKQGLPPLSQAYNGSGILVGFIDSGIDFNHPDFKDSLGNTRILNIWDQNITTATVSPAPFNYGQEWTSADINSGSCTHTDLAYWGHGTHVAGIACGNGRSTGNHQGCAPKSSIITVALNFNATGPVIADAVQYLVNKSITIGKPLAINASVGDYYGSHDATDLQSQMIIALIANIPGRIMVAAAGNAGNIKYHTKTVCNTSDTLFTWIQNSSTNNMEYWLYADTNDIKNIQITVGATNGGYHYLGNIGFKNYNYALAAIQHDTLKNNLHRIGIVHSSASINSFGVYELYLNIIADSSNYLWSIESRGSGLHQAWNFDFVSSGLPNNTIFPKIQHYIMPDTVSSIVTGFQCSSEIITVANYVNLRKYHDYNNQLDSTTEVAGQLAYHSSAGPTRTGLLKPDIAATGNSVFSCLPIAMQSNIITNYPQNLAPGGFHVLGGGTSAASPVVTGLAALYLQAYPNATNHQFKNAVTSCAYSDIYTGTSLPNNKWGYGKTDGLSTFTCMPLSSSQNIGTKNNTNLLLYPNPTTNYFNIVSSDEILKIIIEDEMGRSIYVKTINDKFSETIILPPYIKGMVFIKIYTAREVVVKKLILLN